MKKLLLFLLLPLGLWSQHREIPDSVRSAYRRVELSVNEGAHMCGIADPDTCYIAVSHHGTMGVLDAGFREIVPPVYDKIDVCGDGNLAFLLFRTNSIEQDTGRQQHGLLRADGTVLLEPGDNYPVMPDYPVCVPEDLYFIFRISREPYRYTVVNQYGKSVIPGVYDAIALLCLQGDSVTPNRYYAYLHRSNEEKSEGGYAVYNLSTGKGSAMYDYVSIIDSLTIFRSGDAWGVLDASYNVLISGLKDKLSPITKPDPAPFDDWSGYVHSDFRRYDDSLLWMTRPCPDAEEYGERLYGLVNIYSARQVPTQYSWIERFGGGFMCGKKFSGDDYELTFYNGSLRKQRSFRVGDWKRLPGEGVTFIDKRGRARLYTFGGKIIPAPRVSPSETEIRPR